MAKKRKKNFNLVRILGGTVISAFLIYACYSFVNQQVILARQSKQIQQMKQENEQLEQQYQQLLQNAEDKNTLEYVDKFARSHFGMIEKGDVRIDVVEGE